MGKQIKSKERVKELAEVYTNEREVNNMLDLVPIKSLDDLISYKYLEPACGNGNFLVEILRRKLAAINNKYKKVKLEKYEFLVVKTLTTIYGIDIDKSNIEEAKERMFIEVKSNFDTHKGSFIYSEGFLESVNYILNKNIILGDTINAPEKIIITEFKEQMNSFAELDFLLTELRNKEPMPLLKHNKKHFLKLGGMNEGDK